MKGEFDKAIADCTETIHLNEGIGGSYSIAGRRVKRPVTTWRKEGDAAEAYSLRGLAYAGKGDWDKVIADCTEAIHLDPKDALAYYNRGYAYKMKGDYYKAIADGLEAKALGFSAKEKAK